VVGALALGLAGFWAVRARRRKVKPKA